MTNKIIMDTNVAAKAATSVKECKEEELNLQQECIQNILRSFRLQMQSGWVIKMSLKNMEYILSFWIWSMRKGCILEKL